MQLYVPAIFDLSWLFNFQENKREESLQNFQTI